MEKHELKCELQWIEYRQKMLDIIEDKLLEMRHLTEQAAQVRLDKRELKHLNDRINNLAAQVRALDGESRKTEYEKILK